MNRYPRILAALAALTFGAFAAATLSADGQLIVLSRSADRNELSYLTVRAMRGHRTLAGWIELRNPGRRRQKVMLERVDGATLDTLGSGYAPPGSRPHGATRWLLVRRHVSWVPAHGRIDIPVVVAVPRGARAGEYLSGMSIAALPATERITRGKGIAIASEVRYAIGVLVTVPGRLHPRLELRGARIEMQPPGPVFLLEARNSGNAILRNVHGWVIVTREDRRIAYTRILPGTFVSHSQIAYPVRATAERPFGGATYQVRAMLFYPGGHVELHTSVTYGAPPRPRAFALVATRPRLRQG